MSQSTKLSEDASKHPGFCSVYDTLLESLFLKKKGISIPEHLSLSLEQLRKATWLASIVATGSSEALKNLANSYGALLFLNDPGNEVFRKACYILQSRTGNLLSSKHVPNIFSNGQYQSNFSTVLDFELSAKRSYLTQEFFDSTTATFTDFQRKLWDTLIAGHNTAISAPTSAGKSFIIQKYIVEMLLQKPSVAFYIVPTKALINQASSELKIALGESAHIYTTYRELEKFDKSVVFVLTPERCIKTLQDEMSKPPKIVFFDEIHNLEDASRGIVFENALYRMVTKWRNTQFMFAGPFIHNVADPIKKVAKIKLVEAATISSPVFQIKASITFKPREKIASYRLFSQTGKVIGGELKLKRSIYSKAKNNHGEAIAAFMDNIDKNDSCIVFSPSKSSAEKWANKIAPIVGMSNASITEGASQDIKDLLEYLADEIHPDYCLIKTLRLGVGFHHAGLPDIARMEIEELYTNNHIKNLVCTSTLIQGVNLPADKLIVINPKVGATALTQFEFMNLIGRAGRASTNLYGEVYCLDIIDEEWAAGRITDNKQKTIRPSVVSALEDNFESIYQLVDKERSHIVEVENGEKLYPTISYIRQLHAADSAHYQRILESAQIPDKYRDAIAKKLAPVSSSLSIPSELLQRNPYIDPLLQNKLYELIVAEPLEDWITTKFAVSRKSKRGVDSSDEPTFYSQFESIAQKLNDVFNIEHEINSNRWGSYISIKRLVYDAYYWMAGKSHRYFIERILNEAVGEDEQEDPKVDSAARFVTDHISRNITFIMVKYFSLWSDIVSHTLTEEQKEENAYSLSLPAMIELGSFDPKVLELMSLGINRSIALRLRKMIPSEVVDLEEWVKRAPLRGLPLLFSRYLKRSGYRT
ncbi:DEAD/DEAH box helicase [Pseudomonas alliivorans]|nr:DEAD/DEAH box helicase [Pseudomonas alliivorans]MEE4792653.1 DEAD/DEAH box helicase [Pseudomonas alliivorans]MEE4798886.1 DEAD/DEAH box helicase [Pseudomonas alliivorans]MEE4810471.1 DEAD/DEAH box helicase [Pseudomonas alliivorans]MEE4825556.1 DEAD/DEAH box helicase [Pseudomonas alliivorans]